MPIKNVILDYGLVLCRAPEGKTIDELSNIFGIDHLAFWAHYERNRGAYDRGALSAEEYWKKFAEATGTTLDQAQIEWLRKRDIAMWSHLETDMLLWVDNLRAAGYKTSILSNLNKEFTHHMRTECEWIKRFDFQVFSADLGKIKPEPEIYMHCLDLLESFPEEALFIDDREANVVAARQQGISSILFRSVDQLKQVLESMGFDVLPSATHPVKAT